jgi:hypothetical protein
MIKPMHWSPADELDPSRAAHHADVEKLRPEKAKQKKKAVRPCRALFGVALAQPYRRDGSPHKESAKLPSWEFNTHLDLWREAPRVFRTSEYIWSSPVWSVDVTRTLCRASSSRPFILGKSDLCVRMVRFGPSYKNDNPTSKLTGS